LSGVQRKSRAPPPFVLANLIVDHAREPCVGSAPSGVTGSVSAALEQLVENAYPPSTQPAGRGAARKLSAKPYMMRKKLNRAVSHSD
jgi:hypothetical protein